MNSSNRSNLLEVAVLAALILSAGCIADKSAERQADGPRPNSSEYTLLDHGLEERNGDFTFNATISTEIHVTDPVSFKNASACLYDTAGRRLSATSIGALQSPESTVTFELHANRTPTFVVVDHPEFSTYPRIDPYVIKWQPETEVFQRTSIGSLPFDYSQRGGTELCREG